MNPDDKEFFAKLGTDVRTVFWVSFVEISFTISGLGVGYVYEMATSEED